MSFFSTTHVQNLFAWDSDNMIITSNFGGSVAQAVKLSDIVKQYQHSLRTRKLDMAYAGDRFYEKRRERQMKKDLKDAQRRVEKARKKGLPIPEDALLILEEGKKEKKEETEVWTRQPKRRYRVEPTIGATREPIVLDTRRDNLGSFLAAGRVLQQFYPSHVMAPPVTARATWDTLLVELRRRSLAAFHKFTGELLWEVADRDMRVMLVADNKVFIGNADGSIVCRHLRTGSKAWSSMHLSHPVTALALNRANNTLIVGSEDGTILSVSLGLGHHRVYESLAHMLRVTTLIVDDVRCLV